MERNRTDPVRHNATRVFAHIYFLQGRTYDTNYELTDIGGRHTGSRSMKT
ncbi:hypothetical protein [Paenibacillus lautus]|nr:hypothetical protein [Paenibacillus lautus]MBU5347747.1 hypothetical protein [Paenibacillus lautus]